MIYLSHQFMQGPLTSVITLGSDKFNLSSDDWKYVYLEGLCFFLSILSYLWLLRTILKSVTITNDFVSEFMFTKKNHIQADKVSWYASVSFR